MIAFTCEGCGKAYEVAAALAGRLARCKRCGVTIRVPAAELEPELGLVIEPVAGPPPTLPGPRPVPAAAAVPPRPEQPKGKAKGKGKRRRGWGGVERDGWVALGVGLALAVGALLVPLAGFVIHVLIVVIHELGHVATAWLLASPAVPAFDLAYGGGVSLILDRQPILVLAAYAALGYFLIRSRGDRPALIGWAVAAAVYTLAMLTPLRGLLITGMGHGAELLCAGVFLFRALSGRQILRPAERPLYAAVGLFILLAATRFATGLMTNVDARLAYGDAKGGGHAMDFDLIATTLSWPLERVAGLFLVACALVPPAAYLAHRTGGRLIPRRSSP